MPHEAPASASVTAGAALMVAVLQVWRSNALLSIFSGTAGLRPGDEPAHPVMPRLHATLRPDATATTPE